MCLLGLCAAACALGGCVRFSPAAGDRAGAPGWTPIPEEAWPARRPYTARIRIGEDDLARYRRVFGGMTRDGLSLLGSIDATPTDLGWTGTIRLVEMSVEERERARHRIEWSRMFLGFSAREPVFADPRPVGDDSMPEAYRQDVQSIITVRLFEPRTRERWGTIVHLTGIMGLSPEVGTVRAWQRLGWRVLVVSPPATRFVGGDVLRRGVEIELDPEEPREEELERVGRLLAQEVDARLADWSYTVEAVLDELEREGELAGDEALVLSGLSMGAIVSPAVAARMPGRFDAAVLTAGGGDFLTIMRSTLLPGAGAKITRGGRAISAVERSVVARAYREASRLDPVNAAVSLRGTPVLMLHAAWDAIVPSSSGDRLRAALGEPDRITFLTGHVGLSWVFQTQAEPIHRWLMEHAAGGGERNKAPGSEPGAWGVESR